MYLATVRAADNGRPGGPAPPGSRTSIPGAVIGLGMVSFFTDLSAEMITAILPLYLVYGLGFGYLQLGLVDGLYTGATTVLRVAGGAVADRLGRPKAVAVAGYSLSALTKLALPLAGASPAGIGAVIGLDRAGKGIRTGPRDALITHVTPPGVLGRAFGVHRALDTAGALLGPLLAFALLAAFTTGYDTVFGTSFALAAVGVVILVFFVQAPSLPPARKTLRASWTALTRPALLRVCVAAAVLGVLTVGDMFLYLAVQQRSGVPSALLPLLPLGTALTFMAAAVPIGRLADRIGRWKVFLGGHGVLLVAYLVIGAGGGWIVVIGALGLHGIFYAATDGVLMAVAAPSIPAPVRASGLAAVQAVRVLARAVGAVGFGAAAAAWGLGPGFAGFAVALAVCVIAAAFLTREKAEGRP